MDRESLLDDLEAAECTYSYMEEEMRELEAQGLGDGDEKWENLYRDMNTVQNEIAYLETCLEDCDYE